MKTGNDKVRLVLPVKINGIYCDGTERFADCRQHFDRIDKYINGVQFESSNNTFYTDIRRKGIYLNWELPEILRKGEYNNDTNETEFPPAFDRWHLIRMVKSNGKWHVKTTVIESNYLSEDNEQSSVTVLLDDGDELKPYYLGRACEYQKKTKQSGQKKEFTLTAIGNGDPYFCDCQPACENVFGYFDSLEDLTYNEDTEIHYLLLGYYSDLKKDLYGIREITGADLMKIGFSLNKSDECLINEQTLAHGIISITCSTENKSNEQLRVSIGNNSVEAFSAGASQERMLQLLLHEELTENITPDTILKNEKSLHDRQFSTLHVDEIYGFTNNHHDRKEYTVLNALNRKKQLVNRCNHQIQFLRQECYYLWQYYHETMYNNLLNDRGKDTKYQEYYEKLKALEEDIYKLQDYRNDLEKDLPESDDCIKVINDEPYYMPNNPTIMIQGVEDCKTNFRNENQEIYCRVDSQLLRTDEKINVVGTYADEFGGFITEAIIILDNIESTTGIRPDSKCLNKNNTDMSYPFLIWNLQYRKDADFGDWKLDSEDFVPKSLQENHQSTSIVGRCYLAPHIDHKLKYSLKRYCQIKDDSFNSTGSISQTLGTFNEQMTGIKSTFAIPLKQSTGSGYKGEEYADFVEMAKLAIDTEYGKAKLQTDACEYIRAGRVSIGSLMLIDRYGRPHDVDVSQAKISEALEYSGEIILPPRILHPSRILFYFEPSDEPANQCILGWIRCNYVNQTLVIYKPAGDYVAELKLMDDKVTIINTPNNQFNIEDGFSSDMVHVIDNIINMGAAFSDFLKVIEIRQNEMIERPQGDSSSIFIGRPLAVVSGCFMLDVIGASDSLYEELFPLRIGDRRLSDDGLVGFFMDDIFHQEVLDKPEPADKVFGSNEINVKINEEKYILMLMNIQMETSIVSGILPRRRIKLDSSLYCNIENNMACSFRIGPTVQPIDNIIADFPKLPNSCYYLNGEKMTLKNQAVMTKNMIREGFVTICKDKEQKDGELL